MNYFHSESCIAKKLLTFELYWTFPRGASKDFCGLRLLAVVVGSSPKKVENKITTSRFLVSSTILSTSQQSLPPLGNDFQGETVHFAMYVSTSCLLPITLSPSLRSYLEPITFLDETCHSFSNLTCKTQYNSIHSA